MVKSGMIHPQETRMCPWGPKVDKLTVSFWVERHRVATLWAIHSAKIRMVLLVIAHRVNKLLSKFVLLEVLTVWPCPAQHPSKSLFGSKFPFWKLYCANRRIFAHIRLTDGDENSSISFRATLALWLRANYAEAIRDKNFFDTWLGKYYKYNRFIS